ncbi:MAG TPA: aldo/keto reductase [Nitrospiraceae bacterium]|nr:aldo/keto reductase [Nitrospiraceae bacterium]
MGEDERLDDAAGAERLERREVLKRIGRLGSVVVLGGALSWRGMARVAEADEADTKALAIPKRPLGRTGVDVTILGIGGGHLIRKSVEEGMRIVHEAIDSGITFMDNAWDYANNQSEEAMGTALKGKRQQVFLMTKMCTHGRGKKVGLLHLEQSLRRLRTDYLDLWQIHEVGCRDEVDRIFGPGGPAEALLEAQQQGKVRFIGFTGHTDPSVHLALLREQFPFDTCQLPLNVFDFGFQSFERQVLPEVIRQGIAPIAMKSLCGTGKPVAAGVVTAEEAIRYTLSLPVSTLVSGIDSVEVLRQNVRIAQRFVPMTAVEMDRLRSRVASAAATGRFESYKTDRLWSCDRGAADKRFGQLEQS